MSVHAHSSNRYLVRYLSGGVTVLIGVENVMYLLISTPYSGAGYSERMYLYIYSHYSYALIPVVSTIYYVV